MNVFSILRKKISKPIALTLVGSFVLQMATPLTSWALTSGPNAPEFSSFEPVVTTDMVNMFSGDFTYNLPVVQIPDPDGNGYQLSLSYHSGSSPEEEASWVGYGWTLNPGAINRSVRGFPDEYSGSSVTYYNKVRPNWSASATKNLGIDFFSQDTDAAKAAMEGIGSNVQLTANANLRYNNYQGYSKSVGFGLGFKGMANIGLNVSDGEFTFSASVNPIKILSKIVKKQKEKDNEAKQKENKEQPKKKSKLQKLAQKMKTKLQSRNLFERSSTKTSKDGKKSGKRGFGIKNNTRTSSNVGTHYGLFAASETVRSTALTAYSALSYNWSLTLQINPTIPVGFQVGAHGNFNIQANEAISQRAAYGYFNPQTRPDDNIMSDYYIERDYPYNKRNLTIGIPFANPDQYMVSGEGMGGAFRGYTEQPGTYHPNHVENTTLIRQMGTELGIGQNIEVGFDFAVGNQKLENADWAHHGDRQAFSTSNSHIFRFENDLGGEVFNSDNTDMETASLQLVSGVPGLRQFEPNTPDMQATDITGATSNITFDGNGFTVMKDDAERYVYGLPVYNKNELNIQVGRDGGQVHNNYTLVQNANESDLLENKTIVGEYRAQAHANTYLLTQILSPEYVDAANAGEVGLPDNADFGGWTRFHYNQAYGDASSWYKWRIPYAGLIYNQNEISNSDDDMGSLNTGEKEVYFLKAVETKSHIAVFVTNTTSANSLLAYFPGGMNANIETLLTGSQEERTDALGGISNASNTLAPNLASAQRLQKLEKIVLFSKGRMDVPLKVVNFEYDYHILPSTPNSSGASPNNGRLTLKKVWFEYEGVFNARISPYIFNYFYNTNYSGTVVAKYPDIVGAPYNLYSYNTQNPLYNPASMDVWGNIAFDGPNRHSQKRPWVFQGDIAPETYDPAAWQLKEIILPSGGHIQIQYEQKDYRYVQDKLASGLVSLTSASGDGLSLTLNLADVGLNTSDADYATRSAELLAILQDEFITRNRKIYFKLLYGLTAGHTGTLGDFKSEYITGYANVQSVNLSGGQLQINLLEETDSESPTQNPGKVCLNYVRAHKGGKLNGANGYDAWDNQLENAFHDEIRTNNMSVDLESNDEFNSGMPNQPLVLSYRSQIKYLAKNDILPYIQFDSYDIPGPGDIGQINPALSYVRIPLLDAKRGGGIRVNRLLMYDTGMENGDAVLFGTDYDYVEKDGKSSGVATNEPASNKEENPLMYPLKRMEQSVLSKLLYGEDRTELEGPIGESILPAASVGHSRIVARNIHSGKTGTGFTVHEFFTVKDYPYDAYYNSDDFEGKAVDHTDISDNKKRDFLNLPLGMINYKRHRLWLAQGYRFMINSMNGQQKATYSYGGNTLDEGYMTAAQEYTYFEPGEEVNMISRDGSSYILEKLIPGKEVEMCQEMRSVRDRTVDVSLEIDVSITLMLPPPIFVTAALSLSYSDDHISTHSTSKVIKYPAMVKSIRSFADGAWDTSENLAFDKFSATPVIVKSNDGFDGLTLGSSSTPHDGSMYTVTIPAHWVYPGMGQIFLNAANTNQLKMVAGNMLTYGVGANPHTGATEGQPIPFFSAPASVISASAVTFKNDWSDSWSDPAISAEYPGIAGNESALNRLYREEASYAYREDISESSDQLSATERITNGGIFNSFTMFDWSNPGGNWFRLNEVTKYSPNGQPVEERNILGIFSCAKFGYKKQLPVVVAQNASYSSVYFYDFEETTDYASSYIPNIVSGDAHSGSNSIRLNTANASSGYQFIINTDISATGTNILGRGAAVRFWMKADKNTVYVDVNGNNQLCREVAQNGEWKLYEAIVRNFNGNVNSCTVAIEYPFASGEEIYIDDFRFQPLDAQMVSYVYAPGSLRLLAQFDDRNFGMFYQYNTEGKLVRKQVETERGLKTITETHYNTKMQNR